MRAICVRKAVTLYMEKIIGGKTGTSERFYRPLNWICASFEGIVEKPPKGQRVRDWVMGNVKFNNARGSVIGTPPRRLNLWRLQCLLSTLLMLPMCLVAGYFGSCRRRPISTTYFRENFGRGRYTKEHFGGDDANHDPGIFRSVRLCHHRALSTFARWRRQSSAASRRYIILCPNAVHFYSL